MRRGAMKPCFSCRHWTPVETSRTSNLGICELVYEKNDDFADLERRPPYPSPVSFFCESHSERKREESGSRQTGTEIANF